MRYKNLSNLIALKIKIAILTMFCAVITFSCKSTDEEVRLQSDGQVAVNINIKDAIFDGAGEFGNKASSNKRTSSTEPLVQQKTIALSDGYQLIAELAEEVPSLQRLDTKSSLNQINKAELAVLQPNIKYKIVVYNADGTYLTEKDYVRGQEAAAGSLMLDGGKSYIFIVYSVNSTTALPAVTFANLLNKTLATSSLTFNGVADIMYYRKDMTVSGASTNYLDVILKHKLSQITTTIDATATAYNITSANSSITRHNSTGIMQLADASITRTGTVGNSAVSFPTLNALKVVSTPTIINANSNNLTSYQISTLTIGPLTLANATPFSDLVITPGVKYNLTLTIVPADILLTEQGIPAVRINGQIWMRHNLGVTNTLNADQNPSIAALHGNYYQWGRSAVVANAATSATAIAGWDGNTTQPLNLWNMGSETVPIKSASDPCPTGFRIPTDTEQRALVDATIQSDIGTSTNSATNYSAAKVFTSKRNANVKLTFPLAGNRSFSDGSLVQRGTNGFYWSSTPVTPANTRRHHYGLSFLNPPNAGTSVPAWGFPVRCIKQ